MHVQIPENSKTLAEILASADKYGTLNHNPEQYPAFHDFIMRMLDFKYGYDEGFIICAAQLTLLYFMFSPDTRITPTEAMQHPFLMGTMRQMQLDETLETAQGKFKYMRASTMHDVHSRNAETQMPPLNRAKQRRFLDKSPNER